MEHCAECLDEFSCEYCIDEINSNRNISTNCSCNDNYHEKDGTCVGNN